MKHSTSTFPRVVAHAHTQAASVLWFHFLGCAYFRFLSIMQFVVRGLPNFFKLSPLVLGFRPHFEKFYNCSITCRGKINLLMLNEPSILLFIDPSCISAFWNSSQQSQGKSRDTRTLEFIVWLVVGQWHKFQPRPAEQNECLQLRSWTSLTSFRKDNWAFLN